MREHILLSTCLYGSRIRWRTTVSSMCVCVPLPRRHRRPSVGRSYGCCTLAKNTFRLRVARACLLFIAGLCHCIRRRLLLLPLVLHRLCDETCFVIFTVDGLANKQTNKKDKKKSKRLFHWRFTCKTRWLFVVVVFKLNRLYRIAANINGRQRMGRRTETMLLPIADAILACHTEVCTHTNTTAWLLGSRLNEGQWCDCFFKYLRSKCLGTIGSFFSFDFYFVFSLCALYPQMNYFTIPIGSKSTVCRLWYIRGAPNGIALLSPSTSAAMHAAAATKNGELHENWRGQIVSRDHLSGLCLYLICETCSLSFPWGLLANNFQFRNLCFGFFFLGLRGWFVFKFFFLLFALDLYLSLFALHKCCVWLSIYWTDATIAGAAVGWFSDYVLLINSFFVCTFNVFTRGRGDGKNQTRECWLLFAQPHYAKRNRKHFVFFFLFSGFFSVCGSTKE